MDYQTTGQDSSTRAWYIIGIIIVLAAFAFWYYYAKQSQTGVPPTDVPQPAVAGDTQTVPLSSGNTTADISDDLSQTPDDTAALNQAAAASAADISGF